jgi:isocitrate lyase
LGVTEDVEPLAETLQQMEMDGAPGPEIDAFEAQWVKSHRLVTFDEAVTDHLKSEGIDASAYLAETAANPNLSIAKRRALSEKYATSSVRWSWDVPRTREGFYHFRAGLPAATKRAIAFAPYADLCWLETADPSVSKASSFARDIRAAVPGKKLVYNLSPSFNWMGQGFTEDALRSFIWDLGKEGFVLQLISLAGIHSTATITNELSKAFKEEGMLAYVRLVQQREKEGGCDVLTHQKWSGANLVDGMLGAIQSGSSGSRSMGEASTEHTF